MLPLDRILLSNAIVAWRLATCGNLSPPGLKPAKCNDAEFHHPAAMNIVTQHPIAVSILMLTASNVFMSFAVFCMRQVVQMNYLSAALCLMGAVYFIFKA